MNKNQQITLKRVFTNFWEIKIWNWENIHFKVLSIWIKFQMIGSKIQPKLENNLKFQLDSSIEIGNMMIDAIWIRIEFHEISEWIYFQQGQKK